MISKSLVVTGASQDVTVITPEIDDHWKMFGKEPWDIGHNLYVYCDIRNPGLRNLVIVHMVIQRISQKYLWLHSFSIYLHTPFRGPFHSVFLHEIRTLVTNTIME
jgi:hypothetical protein